MACGLPVIASPVGINEALMDNGKNGYLAITNEEWTEAIGVLRNNRALQKQMGEAGRAMVEKRYCRNATVSKYRAVIINASDSPNKK